MSGISIVKSAPQTKAAGPTHRVALVFQCTPSCQYFESHKTALGDGAVTTEFRCKRSNQKISSKDGFANAPVEYPHTPSWCAFSDFAYQDSIASINNLMDDVERMSMTAIRLSKKLQMDGLHPNERKASFNFFYPLNGVMKIATGHVHVHYRQIVQDNRLLVTFIEYHPTERNALVEFPSEIMPGMSRRAWVRKDDLVNAPPIPYRGK